MTLSLAILVSLAISLTTTPMMCALFLKPEPSVAPDPDGAPCSTARWSLYERTLAWSLRHSALVLLVLLVTVVLNVVLYVIVPKGFFPEQDTGRMMGGISGRPEHLLPGDAAEAGAVDEHRAARSGRAGRGRFYRPGSGGGGGQTNTGQVFVSLKPLSQRPGIDQVIAGCAANCRWSQGQGCSWCRSRTSASAAGKATPPTSTPCRLTALQCCTNGRRNCWPRWSTTRF